MRDAVDALDVPVVSFNRQPVKPFAAVRIKQGYVRVCFLVTAESKDNISGFGNRIDFAVEIDRFVIVLNPAGNDFPLFEVAAELDGLGRGRQGCRQYANRQTNRLVIHFSSLLAGL